MPARTLSPTPPLSPAVDDEWVNTESGFTFVWTLRPTPPGGGVWVQVLMTQPQPPPEPAIGDTWIDPASGINFIFRAQSGGGGVWVQHMSVGPTIPLLPDAQPTFIPIGLAESATPTVTTSPFPPSTPDPCDLWFDTITGFFFIFYDDGNTRQWVVTNPGRGGTVGPPGPPGPPGVVAPPGTYGDNRHIPVATINIDGQLIEFDPTEIDAPTNAAFDTAISDLEDQIAAIPPPTWDNITGKPSTFPPTLPIPQSGVTGLVGDLALKAPLDSPVFTGNVEIDDPAGTFVSRVPSFFENFTAVPTADAGADDAQAASTAWVKDRIAEIPAVPPAVHVGTTPPPSPTSGQMWWHSEFGQMFIWYVDANTSQWVPAAPASNAATIPAGTVTDYAGSTAPDGWHLCNGAVKLRADDPGLFAAIGTTYNTGGETALQFRVPDLFGRVTAMRDGGTGRLPTVADALGATGGSANHTLTEAQMPAHTHPVSAATNAGTAAGYLEASTPYAYIGYAGVTTASTGSSQPHLNTQPTMAMNKIIKR